MNYGSIGYVMGHEITHGFDDEGRQYDKDGNLREWWEAETTNEFLKKAQGIIDQYSNYTVKAVNEKVYKLFNYLIKMKPNIILELKM